jgi:hypothetical protein
MSPLPKVAEPVLSLRLPLSAPSPCPVATMVSPLACPAPDPDVNTTDPPAAAPHSRVIENRHSPEIRA